MSPIAIFWPLPVRRLGLQVIMRSMAYIARDNLNGADLRGLRRSPRNGAVAAPARVPSGARRRRRVFHACLSTLRTGGARSAPRAGGACAPSRAAMAARVPRPARRRRRVCRVPRGADGACAAPRAACSAPRAGGKCARPARRRRRVCSVPLGIRAGACSGAAPGAGGTCSESAPQALRCRRAAAGGKPESRGAGGECAASRVPRGAGGECAASRAAQAARVPHSARRWRRVCRPSGTLRLAAARNSPLEQWRCFG